MSFLIAVLLGVVQGITEFLPISSSGHLALLQNIFHLDSDPMLDAMLHLGTLLAVFLCYRNDVRAMFRGGFGLLGMGADSRSKKNAARVRKRMALLVIIGTLPLLVLIPFLGTVRRLSGSSVFLGGMLLVSGAILYLADRYGRARKEFQKISVLDVLLVGLGQILSAFPGISRTGTTLSVGMLRGFEKTFAVKFSMLLSVPAVIARICLKLWEGIQLGFDAGMLAAYLVGMIFAVIFGCVGIRILRWTVLRGHFGGFAYYCWGAGIVALLLSLVA